LFGTVTIPHKDSLILILQKNFIIVFPQDNTEFGLCILERKIPVFHWQRIISTKRHVYCSFLNDTPYKRGLQSIVNDGKMGSLFTAAVCVNSNTVTGDMMEISRFLCGFTATKNPADLEFPLWRDDGGILENS
jgi:hypothetical protein